MNLWTMLERRGNTPCEQGMTMPDPRWPQRRTTSLLTSTPDDREDLRRAHGQASLERVGHFVESMAKGALAFILYGAGTMVLSGIFFYFSWKLGISALFVLSGLFPLGASAYLLWRLLRRGRTPRPWRYKTREAAILQLAQRSAGRLTVAEVAMDTALTLQEAEAMLNELVRKGYADLQLSPSGVLVYHILPLTNAGDRDRAEPLLGLLGLLSLLS